MSTALPGLLLALLPRAAKAEPSTALDRLIPAPAGDSFLTVPSAPVADTLRTTASLLGSWAQDPLRIRTTRSGVASDQRVVKGQLVLHAQLGLEFGRRFKLEASAPVVLLQQGEALASRQLSLPAPESAALGDVRVGGRYEIFEQRGAAPSVAFAASLWVPSGGSGPYDGSPGVRFAPWLIVGRDHPHYVWSASIGRQFREPSQGSIERSDVVVSAGAAARLGALQVGPEFWLNHAVERDASDLARKKTGAEALLAARYRVGPVVFSLAGGPGIGQAPGVPSFRALAGVAFAPEAIFSDEKRPASSPGEGSLAQGAGAGVATPPASTSPQAAGSAPPPPEPPAPDQDGDGIPDATDRCVDRPGVPNLDPSRNGCPADQDGDGIPDAQDACPGEKGEASAEPRDNGCPRSVRVQGGQIVILQQVNFKTASDQIQPDSFGLLQQVADVMQQKPEILRVAIDGHTDNKGNARTNVELSRRRAVAVMRWLTEHGVDARRLEARGFGPKQPVDDNKTEAGRARNRRVEFQILKRSPRGEADWQEGSVAP